MTSLNPVFTIGEQIMETIRAHERLSQRALYARALEMLEKVGIPSAARRMADYPHQLSGGQRQRVMLAIALCLPPTPADRRRADHRARCHDPGADPRPDDGPARRVRHGDHHHHPQHGRGGGDRRPGAGDVCRTHRGGGAGRASVRPSAAPLHARPAGLRAVAGPGSRAPGGDPGRFARPGTPPGRLPLRARAAAMPWPPARAALPPLAAFERGHAAACIRVAELARRDAADRGRRL